MGCIDVVEGASADHELLASTALFCRCSQNCHPSAQGFGCNRSGKARSYA